MKERFQKLKRMAGIAILFFIFEYTGGCSVSVDSSIIKQDIIANSSIGHYINNVPFIPQEEFFCGPASLAMVLNFYGLNVSQDDIAKEVYLEKLKGSLNIDLLIYAKNNGFQASYYTGNLDDLKKNISSDIPLILFLNLGYEIYPAHHYIVVTGFNDEKGFIIAHSGKEMDKAFSYKELLNAWGKASFGTLLVTPPAKK